MELQANVTSLAYLVAAVLFILALRGLSSPVTSRTGNFMGMLGMAIAVGTTILSPEITSYGWLLGAVLVGGAVGLLIASRIAGRCRTGRGRRSL